VPRAPLLVAGAMTVTPRPSPRPPAPLSWILFLEISPPRSLRRYQSSRPTHVEAFCASGRLTSWREWPDGQGRLLPPRAPPPPPHLLAFPPSQTYEDVTVEAGPGLNVIVGPNGTGKSSLVCALVLALGGSPALLARSTDARAFVRRGCSRGWVEVAVSEGRLLAPDDPDSLPAVTVVRRDLDAASNASTFSVNGGKTTLARVKALADGWGVQLDNLCQVLPQDRVAEFSRLTADPAALLAATERAIGRGELLALHEEWERQEGVATEALGRRAGLEAEAKVLRARERELAGDAEGLRERRRLRAEATLRDACSMWAAWSAARAERDASAAAEVSARGRVERARDRLAASARAGGGEHLGGAKALRRATEAAEASRRADAAADAARKRLLGSGDAAQRAKAAALEARAAVGQLEGLSRTWKERRGKLRSRVEEARREIAEAEGGGGGSAEETARRVRMERAKLQDEVDAAKRARVDAKTARARAQVADEGAARAVAEARQLRDEALGRVQRAGRDARERVRRCADFTRDPGLIVAYDWLQIHGPGGMEAVSAGFTTPTWRGDVAGPLCAAAGATRPGVADALAAGVTLDTWQMFALVHEGDVDTLRDGIRAGLAVHNEAVQAGHAPPWGPRGERGVIVPNATDWRPNVAVVPEDEVQAWARGEVPSGRGSEVARRLDAGEGKADQTGCRPLARVADTLASPASFTAPPLVRAALDSLHNLSSILLLPEGGTQDDARAVQAAAPALVEASTGIVIVGSGRAGMGSAPVPGYRLSWKRSRFGARALAHRVDGIETNRGRWLMAASGGPGGGSAPADVIASARATLAAAEAALSAASDRHRAAKEARRVADDDWMSSDMAVDRAHAALNEWLGRSSDARQRLKSAERRLAAHEGEGDPGSPQRISVAEIAQEKAVQEWGRRYLAAAEAGAAAVDAVRRAAEAAAAHAEACVGAAVALGRREAGRRELERRKQNLREVMGLAAEDRETLNRRAEAVVRAWPARWWLGRGGGDDGASDCEDNNGGDAYDVDAAANPAVPLPDAAAAVRDAALLGQVDLTLPATPDQAARCPLGRLAPALIPFLAKLAKLAVPPLVAARDDDDGDGDMADGGPDAAAHRTEAARLRAAAAAIRVRAPGAEREYSRCVKKATELEIKRDEAAADLDRAQMASRAVRERWEPPLRRAVARLAAGFSRAFDDRVGHRGIVRLVGLDAVAGDTVASSSLPGIALLVSFRPGEAPHVLTPHRQSGGERSATTVAFLVALQGVTRTPFRLIDEINQGMDPTNERRVFDLLVRANSAAAAADAAGGAANVDADADDGTVAVPQCLLLTPKLLPDLEYGPHTTVLCVLNGAGMSAALGEQANREDGESCGGLTLPVECW